MEMQNKIIPLYLDFSKSYLITGNVIRINDRKNLTEERIRKLNPIDLKQIPLDDALQLGNPNADTRIIVFTDPHCPYCSKLHQELKKVVAKRPDLLFLMVCVEGDPQPGRAPGNSGKAHGRCQIPGPQKRASCLQGGFVFTKNQRSNRTPGFRSPQL